ncbi:MAG: quinone oxidoreductase [Alphaproteobacteria bacterium]|nr:MAG: quinone oxidoreductase [Alphaproteobacteria bacterium]
MARTVIIEEFGGPDVLQIVDRPVGEPGPGEIRIRHERIGLNFIDVYFRTGLYPIELPHALGMEAAGFVEAVGEGVTHLQPGDRAAYVAAPPGAYSEARVMPASQVVKLPDEISFTCAAAIMLKGLTVEYLFHRTTPLKAGDTVLFQAAAGGVGLIACEWAKSEGITLIGTAGSDEKCHEALANGAAHCINYKTENFVERVREITGGEGVDVVMDGVGKDTFEGSLDCLKPLGMMISFGNASGPVPPVDLLELSKRGSLKITRPTLFTHIGRPEAYREMAAHLFEKVMSGQVKACADQRFPLDAVAEAHRLLEARRTTGSTVLIPETATT